MIKLVSLISLLIFFFLFLNLSANNVLAVIFGPYKTSYSIAIFGDSMVDTMGENLEYLQASLKRRYPNITFYYYNYGIGSQNVTQGLQRFHSPFDYKTRHYPPLPSLKPDIIIIGSFAYNPIYPYNRDQHWLGLSQLVQEAKNTGSNIYMLAEIAPLRQGFGKGPNGVNWPESQAQEHASHIVKQLENAVYLATDHLKVPLINAYFATRSGKFGYKKYVDPHDGIHPSRLGHMLTADMIAAKIRLRN